MPAMAENQGEALPLKWSEGFSSASRNLSASNLKDRLSKLATTTTMRVPNPVAALKSNVSFVPAQIPRKRRIQTLCVMLMSLMMVICMELWLLLCSIPPLWPLLAVYMMWVVFDNGPERGGRPSKWMRSWSFYKNFADYYPINLFKEVDLPPDRNYVFGYHPHGIIGVGAMTTFATEATGFSEAFPGIRPHLLTLTNNFSIPIYRDWFLSLGITSVSKKSCSNILKAGPGSSITIVVGGASESLNARPGTADLTLRRRLGFIKVAIQHGASLVPVFSFGENDIFNQISNEKGTTVYAIQSKFQSIFGFTLPLFHGRGLLNYNVGLMPYRRPMTVVIGHPIHTEKCEKPTDEEVLRLQEVYINELTRIWNTYKDTLAPSRLKELSIVA